VSAGKAFRAGVGLHVTTDHGESAADADPLSRAIQSRSEEKQCHG
jgi:hypothetical protein